MFLQQGLTCPVLCELTRTDQRNPLMKYSAEHLCLNQTLLSATHLLLEMVLAPVLLVSYTTPDLETWVRVGRGEGVQCQEHEEHLNCGWDTH